MDIKTQESNDQPWSGFNDNNAWRQEITKANSSGQGCTRWMLNLFI